VTTAPPAAVADPPRTPTPITKSERSLAPDIARGGMLLFIALANVPLLLWGRESDTYGHLSGLGTADHIGLFLEQLIVAERSRPMFAVLFGFGMAVMASRMFTRGMEAKGVRKVMRRRSWWLVAFGLIHATFLFDGDILARYGATALVALFFLHLSTPALKRWLIWSSVYVLVITVPVMSWVTASEGGESPAPAELHPYLEQLVFGPIASVINMAGVLVLAEFIPMILVGILLQRSGWLDRPEEHLGRLKLVFLTGMAVNVASSLPVALVGLGVWDPAKGTHAVGVGLTLLGGMYAGIGYICGFALLAHKLRGYKRRGVPGALTAVGERSLTCYLLQSIIMAPLLTAWGFGLGEDMGYLTAFGVAFGTWLLTVVVAILLDKAGKRGPFEVLLRRLTYGPKRA
jgi:uncharacterized membrane protein YeiB